MKVNEEKIRRLEGINTPEGKKLQEKYKDYTKLELINVIRKLNNVEELVEENKKLTEALKTKMFTDTEVAKTMVLNRELIQVLESIKDAYHTDFAFEELKGLCNRDQYILRTVEEVLLKIEGVE